MPKFRNVSGSTLDIPAARPSLVDDDGVFEVDADAAPGFECQPSNYAPVSERTAKKENN